MSPPKRRPRPERARPVASPDKAEAAKPSSGPGLAEYALRSGLLAPELLRWRADRQPAGRN